MESDQAKITILHYDDGECSENCDLWDEAYDCCRIDLMDVQDQIGSSGWMAIPTRCPGPGTYALVRVEDTKEPLACK